MTQQNGNEQTQRQLAPGMGGQEQVQQPGKQEQPGQKDRAQESQRGQDGSLEQEQQKDLKNQRGQPAQPAPGQQVKGPRDEGSSSEQR